MCMFVGEWCVGTMTYSCLQLVRMYIKLVHMYIHTYTVLHVVTLSFFVC